jgi:ubiquinone/menaquinone biosynthesis C-methylase UbiE
MDRLLEATARAERDHFWFRGFRRFVRPLLDQAVGGAPAARLLDAGCGTGHNLAWLRRYGRPTGIDITRSGVEYARRNGERSLAQASVVHLPFPDRCFDLVTSFDVIYALDDDQEASALREMHRVLTPGGHLVLNVAALPMLRGNHSVLGGEVRRYTRPVLAGHLRQAGFDIRRLTYTNASILPIVASVRALQRLAGHRESDSEISVPAAPVNAVLSGLLAVEALALRLIDMPAGSSLLALARKP